MPLLNTMCTEVSGFIVVIRKKKTEGGKLLGALSRKLTVLADLYHGTSMY